MEHWYVYICNSSLESFYVKNIIDFKIVIIMSPDLHKNAVKSNIMSLKYFKLVFIYSLLISLSADTC